MTAVALNSADQFYEFSFSKPGEVWAPDISGDWAEQNARGSRYCEELIDEIRATDNTGLLMKIIRAMTIGQDQLCGVQVGFFSTLAATAVL